MRWLRLPSSTNDGGAAHVSARWPQFVQQTDFVIYKQTAELGNQAGVVHTGIDWASPYWHWFVDASSRKKACSHLLSLLHLLHQWHFPEKTRLARYKTSKLSQLGNQAGVVHTGIDWASPYWHWFVDASSRKKACG